MADGTQQDESNQGTTPHEVTPQEAVPQNATATGAVSSGANAGDGAAATAPITPARTVLTLPQPKPSTALGAAVRARTQASRRRIPRGVVLLAVATVLFVTIVGGVASALQLYSSYNRARADAKDAVLHLNALRALIPGSASGGNISALAPLLTTANLATAKRELTAADADFVALRADLAPTGAMGLAAHAPGAGDELTAAELLADAGDHGSRAGLLLLGDAQGLLPYLDGGVFAGGKGTPLTAPTIARVRADLATATSEIDRAVADINTANLNSLPPSLLPPGDVALLHKFASQWPSGRATLAQTQSWLAIIPTVLGVSTPATYLVEVMDSGELRPGGGFIGNYALITLHNGQVEPFDLSDTYLLDRPYLVRVGYESLVPAQYPWWPWQTEFGLRDSNLSPDFPTNAQLAMRLLGAESGASVQGVIAITPEAIQRVLQVVGPIPVPEYNVTVTSNNLVQLIEYFQLGVNPLTGLPPSDQISSPSKRFTALLGRALLEKLHGLSLAQMVAVGQTFATDVQQNDAQIYFTDAASEALLAKLGSTAAVPHTPGDAVTINDANDGVNKASQFTTMAYQDDVTLDAQGNATHILTITYRFHATDLAQLYGPDRYQTYLRIYTPPTSKLTTITGFGNILGADQIGNSDLAWRQMWGGYVLVADGTPYTLHVTWVVPHAATRDSHGEWHYTLTYQRQAGAHQSLDVSIRVPGQKSAAAAFSGALLADKALTITYR